VGGADREGPDNWQALDRPDRLQNKDMGDAVAGIHR